MALLRLFVLIVVFCFCLNACNTGNRANFQKWKEPNGKVKVLSTIAMIDDLVKQVGGDNIDTLTLIHGELDPHSYQLVKGDNEKLAFADVIFYNGLGLEHGPSLHAQLHAHPKAIGLGDKLLENDAYDILYYNGQLDPHIWTDISLWAKTVPLIVETLGQIDPKNSEYYDNNGQLLIANLLQLHKEIKKLIKQIPETKRYLVTSHDAFNYFTRAYLSDDHEILSGEWQKRFAAPEGLAPDSQLSSTDIQAIIDHVAKHNIKILFPESNVSKDSIRKIVSAGQSKGLELAIATDPLYGDAMGPAGSNGDTYEKMIKHNAEIIYKCLINCD